MKTNRQTAVIEDIDYRHPRRLDRPLIRSLSGCDWVAQHNNLIITGLSIAVAFLIGTIEIIGLLAGELRIHGGFWDIIANIDINKAGFAIAGSHTYAAEGSFAVTVDNAPPVGTDVQGSNGGASGKLDARDMVTATFSEAMDPSSLLAGWTGASTAVTLNLADNAGSTGNDTLTVNGVNFGTVDLGSGKWVPSGGATLSATMSLSADGTVLTVRIGACAAKCGHVKTGVGTTTMRWNPSTSATDLAGNPTGSGTVTESGGPRQNF